MADYLLTSTEVCELLKIGTRTLKRWIEPNHKHYTGVDFPQPVIRSKGGASHKFSESEITKWIQECKQHSATVSHS